MAKRDAPQKVLKDIYSFARKNGAEKFEFLAETLEQKLRQAGEI